MTISTATYIIEMPADGPRLLTGLQFSKDSFETELQDLAGKYQLQTLLAFADDGVIWGQFTPSGMIHSNSSFSHYSPVLQPATLQQARLFGPQAELLIWPENGGLQASLLQEHDPQVALQPMLYYNDRQLLWGSEIIEPFKDGFTLLQEGERGFPQAIPLPVSAGQLANRRAALSIRHYVDYTADDLAYVKYSRLLSLTI